MKPIEITRSRAEQAYVAIRDSIVDGALEPGTHLVQEELASRLGVSRQPVQQAMALLKNDGLVLELGGRGLCVAPLEAEATVRRYQIRVVLDQLAARLIASQAATSRDFAACLVDQGQAFIAAGMADIAKGRFREAVAHDVAFHSFLYEKSGNPLIATTAEPHWHYLRRVMIGVLRYAERGRLVWEQHREILETLAHGDAERAVDLVTAHVEGAETALLAALREAAPGVAPPDPRDDAPAARQDAPGAMGNAPAAMLGAPVR